MEKQKRKFFNSVESDTEDFNGLEFEILEKIDRVYYRVKFSTEEVWDWALSEEIFF